MSIADHLLSRLSSDIQAYQNLQLDIHDNCHNDLMGFQNSLRKSYVNPEIITVSLRTLQQLKSAMKDFYQRHPPTESTPSLLPKVEKIITTIETKECMIYQNFEGYLGNYCPGVRLEDALQYVVEGKEVLELILSGEADKIQAKDRGQCLAKFVWFLMHYAVTHQNKGFVEGTFDISDPERKIFNFFHNAEESYGRISCHYPLRTTGQLGVDIFPQGGVPLPSGKRTVLFGILATHDDSARMFLKPENYGANISFDSEALGDSIMHGAEYLMHKYKKTFGKSQTLKRKFPGVFHRYPTEVIRKEQTFRKQKDRFLKIVNRMKAGDLLSGSEIPKIRREMEMYGISHMYRSLTQWSKSISQDLHSEILRDIKSYMVFFESRYDHLEYRLGNEIQINEPFYSSLSGYPYD
ncbi:MAG: hypothetical protein ACI9S8_002870 [Chlamydiales bacterium]|jgi:hypothetical protein